MRKLQGFLEKFHIYVLPTAENESRNLMVASQKLQTKAMKQMAEQLSTQMAESFEKAITPTFQKMNESLDVLTESVTRCQQDAIQEILRSFMREMNSSFKMQFKDFNEALEQLKKAQRDTTDYTTTLYQTMSEQLNDSYVKQNEAMKELVNELGNVQGRYMSTATRITQDNQEIQKMQQQDYQRIADYLKESEKTSAKFWVACNQTMQKYVESATAGNGKSICRKPGKRRSAESQQTGGRRTECETGRVCFLSESNLPDNGRGAQAVCGYFCGKRGQQHLSVFRQRKPDSSRADTERVHGRSAQTSGRTGRTSGSTP